MNKVDCFIIFVRTSLDGLEVSDVSLTIKILVSGF